MNGTTVVIDPTIEPLFEVLHQERRVLERLVFRLSEAQMLINAGQDRYLAPAADDVTAIESQLGEVEMLRAILITGLAERWGVDADQLTLRAIMRDASPEHRELLERELDQLRELTREVSDLKHGITATSLEQLEATQTALNRLASGPADVDGRDRSPRSSVSSAGFGTTL